jgi:hypothetical protein
MDFANIDAKTAFQLGFAARCREEKLSQKAACERAVWLEKASLDLLGVGSAISGGAKALVEAAKPVATLAVGVPVGLGLAAGAAGGYGLAKLNEPDVTEDDIKAQELANTYKAYTDRLKARQAYLKYRKAQGL